MKTEIEHRETLSSELPPEGGKKPYSPPRLRRYGSLEELTEFSGNDGLDAVFSGTSVTT
ncbi:MAG: lasso RiPP family leader peptide-containing protein [Acidobacteriota bacterium]